MDHLSRPSTPNKKPFVVALVGNPNTGKTTLLNALTGLRHRVGNWSGVTVSGAQGVFEQDGLKVHVVDLPGIYSLESSDQLSEDQQVTHEFLRQQSVDLWVNVVDASHLERSLYLTSELQDAAVPRIVALNMMDVIKKQHQQLDIDALSQALGCKVVPLTGHKRQGIEALKQAICCFSTSYNLSSASCVLTTQPSFQSADQRYRWANRVYKNVLTRTIPLRRDYTECIDRVVLNRWWGLPIFLAMVYVTFWCAISLGGIFQDRVDAFSQWLLVDGLASLLLHWHWPSWTVGLLAGGVGKGLNTVLTFMPVLAVMFFMLAFWERCGYMARAAFLVDRLMRAVGLPGQSFIPLILGFGCNVPAVMASRTLTHRRDRILTILMTPFMSCSARLAIFAVFVAAFFPRGGYNIVFVLYLLGVVVALFTGWILRKSLLRGERSPFLIELPDYHWPTLSALFSHTGHRLWFFINRAGRLIVPLCLVLGGLNSIQVPGHTVSLLAWVGQLLTPLLHPMGITSDNWPATVGLLTGALAKEVVIATLNTLYTAYGSMVEHFHSVQAAVAYLLFVLLYVPCVSTVGVIARELNTKWAIFSTVWSLCLAYAVAVMYYQSTQLLTHPGSAVLTIVGALLVLGSMLAIVWKAKNYTSNAEHSKQSRNRDNQWTGSKKQDTNRIVCGSCTSVCPSCKTVTAKV